ncbi:MAG: hypothetical protein JWP06_609 [Candidatus Saccharibacteria bacterium]|nr:hypothetical protein [Candidatus Saccharibacteria bacterium]
MMYNKIQRDYGYAHMNKITKITFTIIAFALVGYVASFFVQPPPSGTENELSTFHWSLANSVLYTTLYVGAAILFIIGLSAYKAKLRLAYTAIAVGIVLVGAGLAQVVLLRIFGLLGSPWVIYGGVTLPFVAAGLAIYLGVRSIAKLVGITSALTKLKFVLPLLFACIVLVYLIPHSTSSLPEIFYDISNAISMGDAVFYVVSFGLVFQIKNHSGSHYAHSMKWLMLGLIGSVLISLSILAVALMTGESLTGYPLDILVIAGGLIYLKAGHSFAQTKKV